MGLLIAFGVVLSIITIIALVWPRKEDGRESYDCESPTVNGQKMLFMGQALDVSWDVTRKLQKKIEERSLEIAQSDDRFLVTPDDMKQAYEEVIREEHM